MKFFARHWNGEYSLGRSYWVHTFLISLFAPIVAVIAAPYLEPLPARYGASFAIAVTALGVLAWVWAIKGTWASASKHVSRGGKQFWASAAQVMIVLGALRSLGEMGTMKDGLEEWWATAWGRQAGPPFTLRASADGQSIALEGGLNDGAAAELDRALAVAPSIGTVVFNSPGGWIREGKLVAEVVRKRKLRTYVDGQCLSACTVAFLAGVDRAVAPQARIGFHSIRTTGGFDSEGDKTRTVDLYKELGLTSEFVRKIASTPNSEFWYPTKQELASAGITTRGSSGGETASIAAQFSSRESVRADFVKVEPFKSLVEHYPKAFEIVVDRVWEGIQARSKDSEIALRARASIVEIYATLLPRSSDAGLLAVAELQLEQAQELRKSNPEACADLLFAGSRVQNVGAYLPPALVQKETKVMAEVIGKADMANRATVSPAELAKGIRKAIGHFDAADLQLVESEEARAAAPAVEVCRVGVAYLAAIVALPGPDRARVLRGTFGAPR